MGLNRGCLIPIPLFFSLGSHFWAFQIGWFFKSGSLSGSPFLGVWPNFPKAQFSTWPGNFPPPKLPSAQFFSLWAEPGTQKGGGLNSSFFQFPTQEGFHRLCGGPIFALRPFFGPWFNSSTGLLKLFGWALWGKGLIPAPGFPWGGCLFFYRGFFFYRRVGSLVSRGEFLLGGGLLPGTPQGPFLGGLYRRRGVVPPGSLGPQY